MSILNQLVGFMSKEDVRHLKLYLNRTRSNKDNRKDVELFDYIRKTGQKYDESRIFQKLYDSKDKNALYRLKNRLLASGNHNDLSTPGRRPSQSPASSPKRQDHWRDEFVVRPPLRIPKQQKLRARIRILHSVSCVRWVAIDSSLLQGFSTPLAVRKGIGSSTLSDT